VNESRHFGTSVIVFGAVVLVIYLINSGVQGAIASVSTVTAAAATSGETTVAERIKPVGEVNTGKPMVAAAAAPAAASGPVDGKAVFDTTCHACHTAGVGGAPKFGNKADWAPRIAQGIDVLHQHALHGFHGKASIPMPPRGGNASLSDAQVEAAVDYMVKAAK